MTKTTQIDSKYGIFLTLQVLLEHKLINQETFNKIIKVELKDYPIKGQEEQSMFSTFMLDRNRPRKVVFYGRVSTEHEAQLSALENQMQWYEDIAKRFPNLLLMYSR